MPVNVEIYRKSRAVFDSYINLPAGQLPEDKWSALQLQVFRWQNSNLTSPNEPRADNALGISEEFGELLESIETLILPLLSMGMSAGKLAHIALKGAQGIRGLGDPEFAAAKSADAIADMMVFTTQLCSRLQVDFGTLYMETIMDVMQRMWAKNKLTGTLGTQLELPLVDNPKGKPEKELPSELDHKRKSIW